MPIGFRVGLDRRGAGSGLRSGRVLACILAMLGVGPLHAQDSAAVTTPPPVTADEAVLARLDSLATTIRGLTAAQDSLAAVVAGSLEGPSRPSDLEGTAAEARRLLFPSLLALFVLALAFLVVRSISWLLDVLSERSARRRLLYKRLVPIALVMVWALAIVFILRVIFGLDGQTLLAAGAGLGVVIGFAAQDLLKNVFGGLVIIGDRPFQVGDKIAVGDTYGEVKSIGLRSTKIETPDDNLVTVPNSLMLSGQVANANAGALDCQVVTDLYLPGWVDTRRAKEIAYRAAVTSRYVFLKKPVVVIVKDEVRHTFLTHLRVKAYVQDIRHEFLFMSDVTDRARAAFVEAGLLPAWHGATAFTDVPETNGTESAPETRPAHGTSS